MAKIQLFFQEKMMGGGGYRAGGTLRGEMAFWVFRSRCKVDLTY
jgi:hypothetical protein